MLESLRTLIRGCNRWLLLSSPKGSAINGDAGAVVLDGLDFTGDGYIDVYGCTSLTIKNCRIYNLTATAAKMYWLHVYNDIELKIVVENCFFGNFSEKRCWTSIQYA